MIVNTSRFHLSFLVLGTTVIWAACSLIVPPKQDEPPAAVEQPDTAVAEAEPVAEEPLEEEPQSEYTDEDYENLKESYRQVEDRAFHAELMLLERDAEIMELQRRLVSQQRMIDETIDEIVRTKAKLRSVESKAEAASLIAEAEIALTSLGEMSGGEETEEYGNAAELLEMAADEFDGENYGGTIYLANQAKTLISLAQLRYRDREVVQTASGETAFGLPVPLQTVRRCNIRAGPGTGYRVLATLDPDVTVLGVAYKGRWVHVKLEDGTDGWVYQPLIGRR
jgi:hypothetical protein